jgi:hypothetical protein
MVFSGRQTVWQLHVLHLCWCLCCVAESAINLSSGQHSSSTLLLVLCHLLIHAVRFSSGIMHTYARTAYGGQGGTTLWVSVDSSGTTLTG